MALTQTAHGDRIGSRLTKVTVSDRSADMVLDIHRGPARLRSVRVAAATTVAFVAFWDNAAPTLGTTAPDYILPTTSTAVVANVLEGGELENALSITAANASGTTLVGDPADANTIVTDTEDV